MVGENYHTFFFTYMQDCGKEKLRVSQLQRGGVGKQGEGDTVRKERDKGDGVIWKLKDLQFSDADQTFLNGKWVPARPMNWMHRPLIVKFKEAWAVFTGKAEAFVWPEGQ